ncbi:PLP-dependent aminotransferase family protein [Kitasatospora acidiphila]|uniref:MocR-like pyridoxine biosynthesis transcription factor PdxR n=1 Tax=Kitasatospora acidiphila TaxID=2567942 RepID=UPI003C740BAB
MTDLGTRMSAAEVLISLDRCSPTPLRLQLEQRLRDLIRAGVLTAGTLLPSSRVLAADLGVSRRLVVEVYEQLVAEGYLISTERCATRVGVVAATTGCATTQEPWTPRYDLRPGLPALAEFPRAAWLRAITHAVRQAPDAAFGNPDPRGSAVLRCAVADYLRRARAVVAHPDRIIICAGFTQALSLLTSTLATLSGRPTIALENPGAVGRDRTITAAGGDWTLCPVDEHGMQINRLPHHAHAAVVTPAHQFPLGVTLAPHRRTALLDWARDGRLVIEDDYDAEFRFDRQPLGAVQGLAPEHVAYVGTVSKTLSPALRLGWLVLPSALVDAVTQTKKACDVGSPTLDQLALAHLIDSGAYERHLRRIRKHYHCHRDALVSALGRHLPHAEITGIAAGIHLVVRSPGAPDPDRLVIAAAHNDLAIGSISRFLLGEAREHSDRIVLGYANIRPSAIDTAVRTLAALTRPE